jgi:hypothetical protein
MAPVIDLEMNQNQALNGVCMLLSIIKSNVNAVVHTHSPYTLATAISVNEFQHIIEEAKIVVGNPRNNIK